MSRSTACGVLLLRIEVLRLGMVDDERVGRLLGVQLQLLGQRHADLRRVEQVDDLATVLEVGAGGVPEGVARPAVALAQDLVDVAGVLPGVTELWPAVLADVQERHPMLHALMENARPSALDGGELTLSWAESAAFYKRKAEDPACRDQIATAIRSVTGSSLRLAYALADEDAAAAHPVPALSDDELVEAFMREFDAEELPAEEES